MLQNAFRCSSVVQTGSHKDYFLFNPLHNYSRCLLFGLKSFDVQGHIFLVCQISLSTTISSLLVFAYHWVLSESETQKA